MNNKYLFLMILVAFSSATAYAGVYKWTDEKGKIHYSETRPASNIEAESLRIQGSSPQRQSARNDDDKKEAAKAESKQKAQADKKEKAKPDIKKSKALCQSARKKLATMTSTGRIRERDEKGNISYLSDKQKQAAMKKEREIISKHCK